MQLSFNDLRAELHEETAMAIALGGMRIPYNKERAFSVRLGHYRSGNAIASAAAFRLPAGALFLPDTISSEVNVGIAYGFDYSQTRLSMSFAWRW